MAKAKSILIQNGRIIDPAHGHDDISDLLVINGRIEAIGHNLAAPNGSTIIDANKLIVCPGLVDPHCHLRQPGFEYKETILSGSRAAAAGGFTTICSMANTKPVVDSLEVLQTILKLAKDEASIRVLPLASITMNMQGKQLVQMGELASEGAIGFSDDGIPLGDPLIMRHALEYASQFELPIANHAEDPSLIAGSSMNESLVSIKLGLVGAPRQAEEIMLARDLALTELTGGKYYALHISSRGSVPILRQAREHDINFFSEVTPHHLTLTDSIVNGRETPSEARLAPYDGDTKVNPPLREIEDVQALRTALAEGIIDCIGTDHAPHASHEKDLEYARAAPGFSCFETALASCLSLVHDGTMEMPALLEKMTINPSRAYGLPYGTLGIGSTADILVFDPTKDWVVDKKAFLSKGKNTPYHGLPLKGKVLWTIFEGAVVYNSSDHESSHN